MGVRKFTPSPWLLLHSQLPAVFFLVLQWRYLLGMVNNCVRLLSFQVEIGLRLEVGFVLLSICALWQSDTCGIPLSRPVGPLIVQGSARLSPDGVEIIIILSKRGANCEYFSGIVPGLLCLGVRIQLCTSYSSQSEDATPGTGTNWLGNFVESCPSLDLN